MNKENLKNYIMKVIKEELDNNEEYLNEPTFIDSIDFILFDTDSVSLDQMRKIIKKYNLQYELYFKTSILKISDDNIVKYFNNDEGFHLIGDAGAMSNYIMSLTDDEIENLLELIDRPIEKLYNAWADSTLQDIKENPGKVFHYTQEDRWESIQNDKILNRSGGTGLNNRMEHGIFCVVDVNEFSDGVYGNVCLEIDLESFKTDNNLQELDITFEPSILDYLARDNVFSILRLDNRDDMPSDESPYTVIVDHDIPIKYVRRIK